MPTYEQLYHLDLTNLGASADAWGDMTSKLGGVADEMTQTVQKPFQAADWKSSDGSSTRAAHSISTTSDEISDAITEAQAVEAVLREAHEALDGCKKKLHSLTEEAAGQGLHISPSGEVRAVEQPEAEEEQTKQKDACDSVARRITGILAQAEEIDASAARALKRDAGRKGNFNDKVYMSLEESDAAYAANLMKKGPEMSDADLAELDRILKRDHSDPKFATGFYGRLGQKGTLQLYGQMSLTSADASPHRQDLLRQLQQGMGKTLATATDPGNLPTLGTSWATGMRRLGTQHIQLDKNGTAEGPYGYQVLGGLLRYGDYDPEFLTPIAEHVTQLHQKDPYMFADTKGDMGESGMGFNPSGRNGSGYDPVNSVMEALGHSPESAEDFFTGPMHEYSEDGTETGRLHDIDGKKSYFDYLTDKDYESFPDITGHDPDAVKHAADAYPDSLGHALEAATTGQAWDGDPHADPVKHTAAQAHLVERVVDKFGGKDGPEMLNGDNAKFGAMRDSLGHIGAEYMGDVQRAVSGNDDLPTFGAAAHLDPRATETFISQAGRDPDAAQAITASQQGYTAAQVNAAMNAPSDPHVPLSERVATALHPGSMVAGVMNKSVAESIIDKGASDDAAANDKAQNVDKWVTRGVGLATGAIKIPIVSTATGWMVEDVNASVMKSFQQDTKYGAQYDAGAAYTEGQESNRAATEAAIRSATKGHHYSSTEIKNLVNSAKASSDQSYSAGASWEDGRHG